ncbi:MAG: acyl-CoA thioesterase-1 [Kiritimatiellia bacterium]|jgi:acyl-CoA thioesterase-1
MTRTIKSIAGTMTVLMLAGCTSLKAEPAGKKPVGPRRGASPHFWDKIPVSPSTRIPEEIKDGYWHGQHKRINQAVAKADNTKIVFFGDSITWHWGLGSRTGTDVWKEYYSRYNPINMGNSGDITPVMLYRATHGNLDFAIGQSPKVAVLLCGTNNYVVKSSAGGKVQWGLGTHCPPADVAHGARAVAQVFRRRMPHTRVIMMGILPVSNEAKWAKCRETNAFNAALAYNKNEVIYLDLQDTFLQADGAINKQLFSDGTHLTPAGYRLWAQSLEPIVSNIMRSKPLDPVKIMLIGGSITEGVNSSGSYRRYLDGMLRRSGHLIDFIGSRKKHNNNETQPDSYEYDVDHEGHWDKGAQWLAENMSGLLADNVPDVAVIHMGTKDIVSGSGTAEKIVGDIGKVIGALRAKNKAVKIVLAGIIPAKSKADEIELLNRQIVQYTKTHSTARSPILIADQYVGFNTSSDLADDGVSPTAAGAEKMAEVFASVINKALSNTDRK